MLLPIQTVKFLVKGNGKKDINVEFIGNEIQYSR